MIQLADVADVEAMHQRPKSIHAVTASIETRTFTTKNLGLPALLSITQTQAHTDNEKGKLAMQRVAVVLLLMPSLSFADCFQMGGGYLSCTDSQGNTSTGWEHGGAVNLVDQNGRAVTGTRNGPFINFPPQPRQSDPQEEDDYSGRQSQLDASQRQLEARQQELDARQQDLEYRQLEQQRRAASDAEIRHDEYEADRDEAAWDAATIAVMRARQNARTQDGPWADYAKPAKSTYDGKPTGTFVPWSVIPPKPSKPHCVFKSAMTDEEIARCR